MTRKKFLLIGLTLLAWGAALMALQTYFLISQISIGSSAIGISLFQFLGIPIIFGVCLGNRLMFVSGSHKFATCGIAGFFALFITGVIYSTPLFHFLLDLSPAGAMINEIAIWSKSGAEGEFHFSRTIKLKMMAFHAFTTTVYNWPICVALILGALGPRSPKKGNSLKGYQKA